MICGGVWIPELPRLSTTSSVASAPRIRSASVATAMNFPAFGDLFSGEYSGRTSACM